MTLVEELKAEIRKPITLVGYATVPVSLLARSLSAIETLQEMVDDGTNVLEF